MKVYPEFLESSLRDDLLANHTYFEPAQFAYLLECFAGHYLQQRPVDLLEVTLDPAFARELLASSVDPHLIAPKIGSRLSARLGKRVHLYVMDRGGLGLGMEEVGLGPGDWRNVTEGPVEGDLVIHFLDNDHIVYSRPFEGELALASGRAVRSRFLGRTLLRRYGELYVIFQDIAEPSVLQSLNEMELRIAPDVDQRLLLEIEPAGRREAVRLGERIGLCQLGGDHRLSVIVTPRGQDPEPPIVEGLWIGVSVEGMVEARAVIRESFELRQGRVTVQLSPREVTGDPVTFALELESRREAIQVYRGRVEPHDLLEPGTVIDVRLSATNRSGFRLESTGTGMATVKLKSLLVPEPIGPPAFLSPTSVSRGFSLAFSLNEEAGAGKRYTLHGRRERDLVRVGPIAANGNRVVFSIPPMDAPEEAGSVSLWIGCDDPTVPIASHGNCPDEPLLTLPIYPIAPGGRPITGSDNFVFADELLLFGSERLRLVRWAPGRAVRFPQPEAYPYFLWRCRERPPLRYFLRDGHILSQEGVPFERLAIGSGAGAPQPGKDAREVRIPTQSSGRDAYLYLHVADNGRLDVRKAAGRIHDVALNFEPLGKESTLPRGSALLLAGTALFGVRHDRENLELLLLGHYLQDEELCRGVRISSLLPEGAEEEAWIHVPADQPLSMTLRTE